MNSAFLTAAASYFGINPEQVFVSDWRNESGTMVVTFEFVVGDGDLIGVMDRMRTQQPVESQGAGGRSVQHVDVPDEQTEESALPVAVWVPGGYLEPYQRDLASDVRAATGEYLIALDMLRDEQRAKYLA